MSQAKHCLPTQTLRAVLKTSGSQACPDGQPISDAYNEHLATPVTSGYVKTAVSRNHLFPRSQLMPTPHETATEIETVIETWRSKLLELDSQTAHLKPSPDRWSFSEVVGHLIDSACNNHQRFVRAQHTTELVFPKYEQNEWVAAAHYRACDWESLVELWYHYNRQIAVMIRNIPASKLPTPCTIPPYESCTLGFLVTDYLDHLHHHLGKLSERITTELAT